MKIIYPLLFLASASFAYADSFQGDIYSIDVKSEAITLSSNKGMKTYSVRPDSAITINGVEGKFKDLNLGMHVKALSADPGVATVIKAFGEPSTPAPKGAKPSENAKGLATQLADSHWRLTDEGKEFTLYANGTTNSGGKHMGSWQVIDDHTIEVSLWKKNPRLEKLTVNPDATSLRWVETGRMAVRIPE